MPPKGRASPDASAKKIKLASAQLNEAATTSTTSASVIIATSPAVATTATNVVTPETAPTNTTYGK